MTKYTIRACAIAACLCLILMPILQRQVVLLRRLRQPQRLSAIGRAMFPEDSHAEAI